MAVDEEGAMAATNACLDALDGRERRVLPNHLSPPSSHKVALPPRTDVPWLQPFPDRLWEPVAPSEDEPDAVVVSREGIELAFLAAIQHLPPRQRAVLILRDRRIAETVAFHAPALFAGFDLPAALPPMQQPHR